MRRLIAFLIILPVLTAGWGFSNSLGLTDRVSSEFGVEIPQGLTIPGVDRVFEASDAVNEARDRLRDAAVGLLDDATREQREQMVGEAERVFQDAIGGDGGGDADTYDRALQALDTVAVKGRAPQTGYDREQFGSEWADAAGDFEWTRNGCDTRNDVLARDLVDETFKTGTGNCKVVTGTLPYEPYTGQRDRTFNGSGDYAQHLDIEHVVALGNAWVTGAQQWNEAKRAAFANDPLNLMAVDPSSNRAKGDADFATWLPPNKDYRCSYAAQQVSVKVKYGLWVTQAEHDALDRTLSSC